MDTFDFEKQQKSVDAIMVSKNFVELVRWCLQTLELRVEKALSLGIPITDEIIYDDKLTSYEVIFSEMFEDWHVESILVMNPDCVDVIEII